VRGEHRRRRGEGDGEEAEQDHARHDHGGGGDGVPLEEAREHLRPGVLAVGLLPDLLERLRDVDRELVRRRVLAMVVTGTAVVAEVREVGEILWRELGP